MSAEADFFNMAKTKEQKQEMLKGLVEDVKKQKSMILMDFSGVNSAALFGLRDKLCEAKCLLKVVKKTLFEKSLEKENKKELSSKIKEIKDQLAVAFGFEDENEAGRICRQASKENANIKIIGGIFENEFLGMEKTIELADLPSRNELLARLCGSLMAPISGLALALKGKLEKDNITP